MKKFQYDKKSLQNISLACGNFNSGFVDKEFYDEIRQRKLRAAIWYPTLSIAKDIMYRDTFPGQASNKAICAKGKFPLLIFSHGSQGHRFNQHYLAEFMASHGYVVVAVEHAGDNVFDNQDSKSINNLWNRPLDINFTLNIMLEQEFASVIDVEKIGFAGHSFGGYTGIVLSGVDLRTSIQKKFISNSNNLLANCVLLKNEKIKCFFIMAPALSNFFSKQKLKIINTPISLVISTNDEFLQIDNKYFMDNMSSVTNCIQFNGAGHYIYLMNCPRKIKSLDKDSCVDIGVNRKLIHPYLKLHMLNFFSYNFNYPVRTIND